MSNISLLTWSEYANLSLRAVANELATALNETLPEGTYRVLVGLPRVDVLVIGPTGVHGFLVPQGDWQGHIQELARLRQQLSALIDGNSTWIGIVGLLAASDERFSIPMDVLRPPQAATAIAAYRTIGVPETSELLVKVMRAINQGGSARLPSIEPYVDLKLIDSSPNEHLEVFRAVHPSSRDSVVLHVYTVPREQSDDTLIYAQRDAYAHEMLQWSNHVPRVLENFTRLPNTENVYYFVLADTLAPAVAERAQSAGWTDDQRIEFAARSCEALAEIHFHNEHTIVHRNIDSNTLRVTSTNQPIFTNFRLARVSDAYTVNQATSPSSSTLAPEVRQAGLLVADERSDVYALCVTLAQLFEGLFHPAKAILEAGQAINPAQRPSLNKLAKELRACVPLVKANFAPTAPQLPARYWSEDHFITVNRSTYKVISRLGKGGFGQTFKVIEIHDGQEYGSYVAKVLHDPQDAVTALEGYRLARSHTNDHLAVIHEVQPEWEQDQVSILLTWIDGVPLNTAVNELFHTDQPRTREPSKVILSWLTQVLTGLSTLHRTGLMHADVTPKNIIIGMNRAVLTDFDTVTRIGQPLRNTLHPAFSPLLEQNQASAATDVYMLASSIFASIHGRSIYDHDGLLRRDQGINWAGSAEEAAITQSVTQTLEDERLQGFLQRALGPIESRFSSAESALEFLHPHQPYLVNAPLGANEVPRLTQLLYTYPGGRHGNAETRGLDSDFNLTTYVETKLDQDILSEILHGQVSLVLLFGNAGDGKTAFLQRLAKQLGMPLRSSAERIWEHQLDNGLDLYFNLDGSASYQGRSATELLNEFFSPFQDEQYPRHLVRLLAINSGPLSAWLERQPANSWIAGQLRSLLLGEERQVEPRFRLLDLNARSLVGRLDREHQLIQPDFVESLLEKLSGDHDGTWSPCLSCVAQSRCTAWHSIQWLRDEETGSAIKRQLFRALQAVHQKGEVHITARELRATLSYIFFGLDTCSDLHSQPDHRPEHFWERAFSPDSPSRQGELLRGLQQLDPALEADPTLDRQLLQLNLSLPAARRRAYFIGHNNQFPDLVGGQDLKTFQRIPFMEPAELEEVLWQLCRGMSSLEALPEVAFRNARGVPLRVVGRTQTESAFWVEKSFEQFSLQAALPGDQLLDSLHTTLELLYRYNNGHIERLNMNLDLFSILLDLGRGQQLTGSRASDVFANLSLFTQRLALEDNRQLYAWNPIQEEHVFQLEAEFVDGVQRLVSQSVHRHPIKESF